MDVLDGVFSNRLNNIQTSLDLTTERQQLLTNNLANINVPGYKREDMDFHLQLSQASGLLGTKTGVNFQRDLASFQSDFANGNSSIREDGNNVDLDKEIASMTETQMHYQALSTLAANYFQNLKTVIS